jgi:predicted permease
MVGATLLVRSVGRILAVDAGFEPAGVTTFTLVTSDEMPNEMRRQFFRDLVARVSTLPGVTAAGLISRLPLRDGGYESVVRVEGRPDLEGAQRPNALYRNATPGFFRAMGMRLTEGRFIDSTDAATAEPVTLITESFARKMWPGESALGKHIGSTWSGALMWRKVVGVVAEPKLTSMTGDSPFAIFVPLAQHGSQIGDEVLVVRGGGSVAGLVPSVRSASATIDPRVGMTRISTMDDVVAEALAQPLRLRFFFSVFAVLALVLGVVGVYGVVSYAVSRRRAEFGVRMALGATPARVRVDVMRLGLAPVVLGVVAGLVSAGVMAGILTRFLYGFAPLDPASFGVAALALLAAGAGAAIAPAMRASRASPVEALRAE